MTDDEFEALKVKVAGQVNEMAADLEQLLAEIRRRDQLAEIERQQPGTVHPIRPGPGNS